MEKWSLKSIQERIPNLSADLAKAVEKEQKAYELYKTEEARLMLATANSGYRNQAMKEAEVKIKLEEGGLYRNYHEKRLARVMLAIEKDLIEDYIKIEKMQYGQKG